MLETTQQKTRGMVNGNVLAPLPSERTPLATDPALRDYIQRVLNSYPNEVPNRTDIDPRMLNTNSPQRVDGAGWDTPRRLRRGGFAGRAADRFLWGLGR